MDTIRILVQDLFGLERDGLTPAVVGRGAALGEPGQGQLLGRKGDVQAWPSSSGPGPGRGRQRGAIGLLAFARVRKRILDHERPALTERRFELLGRYRR